MNRVQQALDALLRSHAQVLLSRSRLGGLLLLLATLIDPIPGLHGLAAVALALLLGRALHLPEPELREGIYGYNPLLVGLGVGASFTFGPIPALLLLVGVGAAVLGTAATRSVLGGALRLPGLSLPFVLVLWLVLAAGAALGLPPAEPTLALPDLATDHLPQALHELLRCLGAVFFLPRADAGALVLLALIATTRIGTGLALLGFALSLALGGTLLDPGQDGLRLALGFNLVLTALAVGGTWFVPGLAATLLAAGAAAVAGLLTVGLAPLLSAMNLPVSILPFNLVVLVVLAAMRQRSRDGSPWAVDFLAGSPEQNLRHHQTRVARFGSHYLARLHPPFLSTWTVTQGQDGPLTHRGPWRSAFDFEVSDAAGLRHAGEGSRNEDWLCWHLPVLAPAPATVAHVVDGHADTPPGEQDLHEAWGNVVVLHHGGGLFSVLAHLSRDTIKVRPGQLVQRGELLGLCGSSGRSPVPHLHFQLQSSATVGAPTLLTELHEVVEVRQAPDGGLEELLHATFQPPVGTRLRPIAVQEELARLLRFDPGTPLHFRVEGPGGRHHEETVLPELGLLGDRRLRSPRLDATLFYESGDRLLTVYDVVGSARSVLHLLHAALPRVPYEASAHLTWTDHLPHGRIAMRYRSERQGTDLVVLGQSLRRAGPEPLLRTRALLRPGAGLLELSVTRRGHTTTARRIGSEDL